MFREDPYLKIFGRVSRKSSSSYKVPLSLRLQLETTAAKIASMEKLHKPHCSPQRLAKGRGFWGATCESNKSFKHKVNDNFSKIHRERERKITYVVFY